MARSEEIIALVARAREALLSDSASAYDMLAPEVLAPLPAKERERCIHPLLGALSGFRRADEPGDLPDTRALLEAEPRWAALLIDIVRDASIHADFRVEALALLSRIQAPEPRELVLDFADHTDFENLAEIVRAYDDPALVEALIAKAPRRHYAGLAMFLGLPKLPKPKKSAARAKGKATRRA